MISEATPELKPVYLLFVNYINHAVLLHMHGGRVSTVFIIAYVIVISFIEVVS